MFEKYNMVRLSDKQIKSKLDFIKNYCNANNAADGSTFDPNSNVITKNLATMNAELNKDSNIQVKRALIKNQLYVDLLNEIDVLVDGPFVKDEFCPNIKFRGSKNQRLLDIPRSLKEKIAVEIA